MQNVVLFPTNVPVEVRVLLREALADLDEAAPDLDAAGRLRIAALMHDIERVLTGLHRPRLDAVQRLQVTVLLWQLKSELFSWSLSRRHGTHIDEPRVDRVLAAVTGGSLG